MSSLIGFLDNPATNPVQYNTAESVLFVVWLCSLPKDFYAHLIPFQHLAMFPRYICSIIYLHFKVSKLFINLHCNNQINDAACCYIHGVDLFGCFVFLYTWKFPM